MKKSLRVGIIGASAVGGWAKDSHVPAVQKLDGLELTAVAASNQKSADAAAKAFGAKAAFGKALDLIRRPDVDIVSICVKVPDHREMVLAAIAAGKSIYCEWPLGKNLAEAEEVTAAAEKAGVRTMIGLQTRGNSTARLAGELVRSGAIGRVLSARVYSTTAGFGPEVPQSYLYLEDPQNGANLVTIQGAHTLDLAINVLGPFADATAQVTTQFPQIQVGDENKPQLRTTNDHILVQARLAGRVPLSVEVAGGRPPEATPFRFEVTGERGDLILSGGAARGVQAGRLALSLSGDSQPVDAGETASVPDAAVNVAGMYAAFRDHINNGASTVPDFRHAVQLTRLIEDLLASAKTGVRKSAVDWPT